MLRDLQIKNFAIVDELTINFTNGINVLTGETGAGKSLIIDALEFVFGHGNAAELLKSGRDQMSVEALFEINADHGVTAKLQQWGIPWHNEIIVKREYLLSSSKTRSFINGQLATILMINELGMDLLDIHSQHEHQAIFNIENHRKILDRFGHLEKLVEKNNSVFVQLKTIFSEQNYLMNDEKSFEKEMEYLKFQINEIESINLSTLNEENLKSEFLVLKKKEKILELLHQSQNLFQDEMTGGVFFVIGKLIDFLKELTKFDADFSVTHDRVETLNDELKDIALTISQKIDVLSIEDGRLNEISEILDLLNRLKKKYGNTVSEIKENYLEYQNTLKQLETRSERLSNIATEILKISQQYYLSAFELSQHRAEMARSLSTKTHEILSKLGMPRVQFQVSCSKINNCEYQIEFNNSSWPATQNGWDKIEFLFSANIDEEPKVLTKIASGGEASRIMLAIKSVLAESDDIPTIVFDEIDTGIGGRSSVVVGEVLSQISKFKQLICITHLPSIAALGVTHYQIYKRIIDNQTKIMVRRLNPEERIQEIAHMIAGEPITEISISHAKELYDKMQRL